MMKRSIAAIFLLSMTSLSANAQGPCAGHVRSLIHAIQNEDMTSEVYVIFAQGPLTDLGFCFLVSYGSRGTEFFERFKGDLDKVTQRMLRAAAIACSHIPIPRDNIRSNSERARVWDDYNRAASLCRQNPTLQIRLNSEWGRNAIHLID